MVSRLKTFVEQNQPTGNRLKMDVSGATLQMPKSVDTSQVQEPWWSVAGDDKKSVNKRLDEFMYTLLFSEYDEIVVAGHSHLFRDCFRKYLGEDAVKKDATLCKNIIKQKIQNAGVVKLELPDILGGGETDVLLKLSYGVSLSDIAPIRSVALFGGSKLTGSSGTNVVKEQFSSSGFGEGGAASKEERKGLLAACCQQKADRKDEIAFDSNGDGANSNNAVGKSY